MLVDHGWAYATPPFPGELLTSCLARNARAHGDSPYRFMALFWQRHPTWERDFDRNPTRLARPGPAEEAPDWLDDLSVRLRVPRRVVEEATLASWRERLGSDPGPGESDIPLLLSAGVFHRSRTRHGLQFCPECLSVARPFYRKEWRLGFVLYCDAHRRPLLDACAQCDAPVVPHRSETSRLTDCHRCGGPIRGEDGLQTAAIPQTSLALQRRLLSALNGGGGGEVGGPLSDAEALATVRTLLAASAARHACSALRQVFGLNPAVPEGPGRRRFEHARHAVRAPWIEAIAAWLDHWPDNFLPGAQAIGATQRTFARSRVPPMLAAQVARLPERKYKPRRPWQPLLDEPVLRRLRRTDRAAYHAERAERILRAMGRA